MLTFNLFLQGLHKLFISPSYLNFTAAAVVGAAVVGSAASNRASSRAERGVRSAADAQVASTERNIEFQEFLLGEQQRLSAPYREAGERALGQYEEALGQPVDLEQDPSYQFRLSEGLKGVQRSGSARGQQLSGGQLKGLARYGQNFASTEYGAAYQRRQQGIANLYNLATLGQAAAAGQAQQTQASGANISNSILQAGQAQGQLGFNLGNIGAAQSLGQGQAVSGAIGQIAQLYGAGAFSGGGGGGGLGAIGGSAAGGIG